jgi:MFS family permease
MIAGPFFNVYLKDNLGASNFEVGWLTTASALSGLAAQLLFGDLLSRRGPLPVTRLSLLVIPFLPWMWVFVTSPWMVLAPNLIGGAMWAAFGLANFQHLLEITEERDREAYVAMFHMSVFLALFLAPFVGGLVIDYVGYKQAFVLSGAGRFVSTAMFFLVVAAPSAFAHEKREAARPTNAG